MKHRIIRFLCLVLVLATLLPCVPVSASSDPTYGWALVDFCGARARKRVLQMENTIYAPLSWISYYGADMIVEEKDNVLVYYREDQKEERTFAKRLFIDRLYGTYTVGIYFKESDIKKTSRMYDNYYPLCHGNFSSLLTYDNEHWAPIEELLPLMDVRATVGDDGYLYMQPVVMTTFRALYEHSKKIKPVLFDAESQIKYKDAMKVGGYALGNLMDFRLDRQVVSWSYGMQNDYEEIFKSYLMDDTVFLETFDTSHNIYGEYISDVAEGNEEVDFVFNIIGDTMDSGGTYESFYEFVPEEIGEGFKGMKTFGEGVKGIFSLMSYADIYFNHIEDHRKMLDAVYTYEKKISGTPSGKAASSVSKIYNRDADNCEALVIEGILDLLDEAFSSGLKDLGSSVLNPWYLALEISKLWTYDEQEYIKNAALIDKVDNTVSYSYGLYGKRVKKADFSEDNLDDIRLSLMMSLVGSRFAYNSYWDKGKEEELDTIADVLEDLYVAGVFREHETADSYETLHEKYRKELKDLILDDPTISASLAELEYSQVIALFDWNAVPYYEWTLVDVDVDGVNELVVQGTVELETALGMKQVPFSFLADATSGTCAFRGPILGLIYPEVVTADGKWYLQSDDVFYTWGGLRWKKTDTPTNVEVPSLDCPSLNDFFLDGDPEKLMKAATQFTDKHADRTFSTETDIDGDGDQDLLAVFADPANRWAKVMDTGFELGYDIDIRTDGLLTFLVVLREEDGIRVRTNTEYCGEIKKIVWSQQDRLLDLDGSIWKYMDVDYPFVPMESGGSYTALTDLLGASPAFVKSVLTDYQEEEGYDAPYAMGYLNGDSVYVEYEDVQGEYIVQSVRLDCFERDSYIMPGIPSSIENMEFFNALGDQATDWTEIEPAYGPDDDIYAYQTSFNYYYPGTGRMYTVLLMLEDELYDAYINSIYFMDQYG